MTQSTPDALRDLADECLERATYLKAMEPEGLSTIERQSMETLFKAATVLSAPPVSREGPEGSGACLSAPGSRVCDPQPASLSSPVGADPSRDGGE